MNRPPSPKASRKKVLGVIQQQDMLLKHNTFWKETLMMAMHSLGLKRIDVSETVMKSLSQACPPGEIAYLITTKNEQDPKNIGFALHLAFGNAERDAILATAALPPMVLPLTKPPTEASTSEAPPPAQS